MPGSPYIETPKGLLTWPKILIRFVAPVSVLFTIAIWQGVGYEFALGLVIIAFSIAFFRKK